MLTLSTRNQMAIGLLLVSLMILHAATTLYPHTPGGCILGHFLSGWHLSALSWPLPGFFALSWGLDFSAYTWGGVSDFCITGLWISVAGLWLTVGWPAAGTPNINLHGAPCCRCHSASWRV